MRRGSNPSQTDLRPFRQVVASGLTFGLVLSGVATGLSAAVLATAPPAQAAVAGSVVVKKGDSLWVIARRTGTTVSALQAANGLSGDLILIGQVLVVPSGPGSAAPPTPAGATAATPGRHVIVSGDNLWTLARHYGVSLQALMSANGMVPTSLLLPGRTLVIPSSSAATDQALRDASARVSSVPYPVARQDGLAMDIAIARNRAVLDALPAPSSQLVRQTIVDVAGRHGVDPTLALAIGYQESRFSQHVISHANAIGTMQVVPATARWISTSLAGRPLNPFLLDDNVTAGVLYIKYLLSRLPPTSAIGAYYQGPTGVQRDGIAPATHVYIADVLRHQASFR